MNTFYFPKQKQENSQREPPWFARLLPQHERSASCKSLRTGIPYSSSPVGLILMLSIFTGPRSPHLSESAFAQG